MLCPSRFFKIQYRGYDLKIVFTLKGGLDQMEQPVSTDDSLNVNEKSNLGSEHS